jgi:plasmid replication initiation protein
MFRLMNKPRYEEGSKLLTVDMDKDIIPYIKPLKDNYTRYEIENLLSLRSSYSARIYELMKMKEYRGFRELTVDELREYCGIEEGEYKAFKDFEKRVLKVAKKEINENTDITISYEKVKSGRRIHRIEFTIKSKDDEKEIWIDYLEQSCNVKEFKEKAGLSNEKLNAAQVIELYGIACEMLDGVEEKDVFEYIRLNYLYGKDKARNIYAYLKKALREDYAKARGQIRFDYYID